MPCQQWEIEDSRTGRAVFEREEMGKRESGEGRGENEVHLAVVNAIM